MLQIVPAGVGDLVSLLENQGNCTLSRSVYGGLLAQLAASVAFAIKDSDGRVICIGGVAPVGDEGEIWFGVKSGGLGGDLLPVVRVTRVLLPALASRFPGGMFTSVADGHLPGERLARLIGCVETDERYGGYRRWACRC